MKMYESPRIEIIDLDGEDVVTNSFGGDGDWKQDDFPGTGSTL